jgi:hypothetical protein
MRQTFSVLKADCGSAGGWRAQAPHLGNPRHTLAEGHRIKNEGRNPWRADCGPIKLNFDCGV